METYSVGNEVISRPHWNGGLSKSLCKKFLLELYGLVCWGCGFEPPMRFNGTQDERLLQIDHLRAKKPSAGKGGSDELYNLAILCPPCNATKSNNMTLDQLREYNKENGFLYVEAVNNLVKLDDREEISIREIFNRAKGGETAKTLQNIFGLTSRATLTVGNPSRQSEIC